MNEPKQLTLREVHVKYAQTLSPVKWVVYPVDKSGPLNQDDLLLLTNTMTKYGEEMEWTWNELSHCFYTRKQYGLNGMVEFLRVIENKHPAIQLHAYINPVDANRAYAGDF